MSTSESVLFAVFHRLKPNNCINSTKLETVPYFVPKQGLCDLTGGTVHWSIVERNLDKFRIVGIN